MKLSVPHLMLPLAMAGLSLLTAGCSSSTPTTVGLRSCFDTGSSVVCTTSSALSTASVDVNGDGKPDVFVCADDDADDHDRKRDKDQTGRMTASRTADEDNDGVADDLDCGHRTECHGLTNEIEESGEHTKTKSSLSGGSGERGGSSGMSDNSSSVAGGGGADNHGSGGASGDNHGSGGASGDSHGSGGDSHGSGGSNSDDNHGSGGTSGDDHGSAGSSSGDDHGSGGHGDDDGEKDDHPQTGCQPPPLSPPPAGI